MHLKNIKLSVFLLSKINTDCLRCEVLEKRTSFVVKTEYCIFTLYKHTKSVLHLTGIKSKENLKKSLVFIVNDFHAKILSFRIDNTLFSSKNNIDIDYTIKKQNKFLDYYFCYKPECFPALVYKPRRNTIGHPTILLFFTGSFVLLGGKNILEISKAKKFVENLINRYAS